MVAEVSVEQLAEAQAAGGLVIDVRETDEFAAGHVADSRLIPLHDVPFHVADLPTDQPVYVICRSGNRSWHAAAFLAQRGIDARNVEGGVVAWARSGRPLVAGSDAS